VVLPAIQQTRNALLVSALSEAYQVTKNKKYRSVIVEILNFISREMTDINGGFYSALDADSEGEEGKFYVWDKDEINDLLGSDAVLFCEYYNVTAKGNFESKNILNRKKEAEEFSNSKEITTQDFETLLNRSKKILLEERNKRTRPGMDDKIILGWNALMNTAYCKAYAATGIDEYRDIALKNMQFLLSAFSSANDSSFFHTWKIGQAKHTAFLDDYAYLIEALIHLQEITGDTEWLQKAKELTEFVIRNFSESESGYFFYTASGSTDVIIRKKEVYDGATPSGNAVMASNLYKLSVYFNLKEWGQHSLKICSSLGNAVIKYPTSFGYWANLFLDRVSSTNEIAIVGVGHQTMLKEILAEYVPNKVIMCAREETNNFPLLAGKKAGNQPLIYLCRNYTCRQPVQTTKAIVELLLNA
jgi:uncharacterized protein